MTHLGIMIEASEPTVVAVRGARVPSSATRRAAARTSALNLADRLTAAGSVLLILGGVAAVAGIGTGWMAALRVAVMVNGALFLLAGGAVSASARAARVPMPPVR